MRTGGYLIGALLGNLPKTHACARKEKRGEYPRIAEN